MFVDLRGAAMWWSRYVKLCQNPTASMVRWSGPKSFAGISKTLPRRDGTKPTNLDRDEASLHFSFWIPWCWESICQKFWVKQNCFAKIRPLSSLHLDEFRQPSTKELETKGAIAQNLRGSMIHSGQVVNKRRSSLNSHCEIGISMYIYIHFSIYILYRFIWPFRTFHHHQVGHVTVWLEYTLYTCMDSKKKNVHVCRPCCTVKSWCLIMLDIHHINRLARFGSSTGIQDQLYIELWDKKIISKRSEILNFFRLNSVVFSPNRKKINRLFVNFVSTGGRFDVWPRPSALPQAIPSYDRSSVPAEIFRCLVYGELLRFQI